MDTNPETLCSKCGEHPPVDGKDDLGRPLTLCDNCLTNAGEAQSERKLEA